VLREKALDIRNNLGFGKRLKPNHFNLIEKFRIIKSVYYKLKNIHTYILSLKLYNKKVSFLLISI